MPRNVRAASLAGILLFAVAASPATAIVTRSDPAKLTPPPGSYPFVAKVIGLLPGGGTAPCSGAVIEGGAVLTAAHCVTNLDTGVVNVKGVTVSAGGASTTVPASGIAVAPGWNGNPLTSPADIAVLTFATPLTTGGLRVPTTSSLGKEFNFELAGYGPGGQGTESETLPYGTLRVGSNTYNRADGVFGGNYLKFLLYDFDDYTEDGNLLGGPGYDPIFTTLPAPGGGTIQVETGRSFPYLFDFDRDGNGVPGEAIVTKGDSGGPSWSDRTLFGIHSFVFDGTLGGDAVPFLVRDNPPVGTGWIGASVDVAPHAAWIASVLANPPQGGFAPPGVAPVPLPPSAALLGGALALAGWFVRRR